MLARKYDASESEPKWQEFWEENGIFRFDPDGDGPIYSIDTPPPTVSGAIHLGHVYSYTQAEMIARFWRMKGHRVFYPFGFDDNGLPTERLVEREHQVRAVDLERAQFAELCLATTRQYEAAFKSLWQSLGFSVDWDLEYSTIDHRSQRTSQLSFIELYEKGLAYQTKAPVMWCTECQTSLAQAEIDTVEQETVFHTIVFGTSSGEGLEIATTRPELLPACVAVFIHPDDEARRHLIGQTAITPIFGESVPILADDAVQLDKGTGAVMCCTFGDQQDIAWWKKHNLPLREIVGRDGLLDPGTGVYSGLTLIQARKAIVKDLNSLGLVVDRKSLLHQVAVHERCGTATEYLLSKQWYIRLVDHKDEFLEAGEKINWHPSYMKHRYMEWVRNLEWDWCISRQRFFGVPFPLWYCAECGAVTVADRSQLPVDPLSQRPSRPCDCGSTDFIPESDVFDTWATSSVTPLVNAGWQGGSRLQYPIVPMSLRPQAHDIIRTWAFYTIVKSLYHLNRLPWNDVMISGFVMAGKGEKLSKSKGNAGRTPQQLVQEYSADVVRLWASTGKLGTDTMFSEDELKRNGSLPIKLWNASRFILGHLQDYEGGQRTQVNQETMDRWVLQRLTQCHQEVSECFETFEISQGKAILDRFFWNDFCDNYLEIVKDRLYNPEVRGVAAREAAQQTLHTLLFAVLKMYAIYMPHITEEIYQSYFRTSEGCKSIHLCPWNQKSLDGLEKGLLDKGQHFVDVVSQVRKHKSEKGLSLGSEVDEVAITCSSELRDFLTEALGDLRAVTRAKSVKILVADSATANGLLVAVR